MRGHALPKVTHLSTGPVRATAKDIRYGLVLSPEDVPQDFFMSSVEAMAQIDCFQTA